MEKYDTGETRVSGIRPSHAPPDALSHDKPTRALDEFEEFIGQTLDDRFRITGRLGKGGMSAVFRADHLLLERTVAVKVLHRHLCSNVSSIQRFHREAKAISTLDHENIVKVHAFGQTAAGHCYLVMDLVQAQSLAELLVERGALPVEEAIPIVRCICHGLAHIHQKGIVHRDLKPANIMVSNSEGGGITVKIVDFGIARMEPKDGSGGRLTEAGSTCGSPPYMSPEQCMGESTDHRSDIYSLGILVYELLAGQRPFVGQASGEIMLKHLNEPPPLFKETFSDLRVPLSLEAIVHRCLAKQPDERYESVSALLRDLCEVGSGSEREEALSAAFFSKPPTREALPRRHVFGLLLVTLCGVIALSVWGLQLPQTKLYFFKQEVDGLFSKPSPDLAVLQSKALQLFDLYETTGDRVAAQKVLRRLTSTGMRVLPPGTAQYASLLASCGERLRNVDPVASGELTGRAIDALLAYTESQWKHNKTDDGARALAQCVRLCERTGQRAMKTLPLLFVLSVRYKEEGRLVDAEDVARKILEITAREPRPTKDSRVSRYYALGQLGDIYLCRSDAATALDFFEQAQKVGEQLALSPDPRLSSKIATCRGLLGQEGARTNR